MTIVTLEAMKGQLRVNHDDEDDLIEQKISAAQNHLEQLLGFKIEETYGGEDQDAIPPALVECVTELAAHWYENREAVVVGSGAQPLPIGVDDVVREFRNWSWAD